MCRLRLLHARRESKVRKYVATKKELIALKDHVKQAERSTREAIASLDAEVRMYRRLLDPQ